MDDLEFEGTLVLERLAAVGLLDDFFAAVDADDVRAAEAMMRAADVDRALIVEVATRMRETDAAH